MRAGETRRRARSRLAAEPALRLDLAALRRDPRLGPSVGRCTDGATYVSRSQLVLTCLFCPL